MTPLKNNLIYLDNYPEIVDVNIEFDDMYWQMLCAPNPSSENKYKESDTVLCLSQKHFKKFIKLADYDVNWDRCDSKERFPSKYPCIVQLYRHFEGGMIYTSIKYNIREYIKEKYIKEKTKGE